MSYILDALRRADSERERGAVPSLHTQQYGALPGDDEAPARSRLLVGVIVALVLALGAALAWNLWGGDAGRHGTAPGPVPIAVTPPAALPTPLPALATSAASPAPVALSAAPVSALPATAAPQQAASAAAPTTATRGEARSRGDTSMARVASAERRRMARDERASGSAAALAPSSSTAAGDNLAKLPEAMRRELPTLAFGGASYSHDAASRMVIFNGRVFHEGDTVAPQLVLQQIKLKSAVLAFRGYRYELEY